MLAVATSAPHHGDEIILKGPSGIITPHGPIGPTGPAHGGEHYHGGDDGQYHGEGAYHHAAAVIAPAAHYYAAPAPAVHHPEAGYVAFGHHGVEVKGPLTVPAVVSGPSGKIYAKGLYGVPNHPHHHYWFNGEIETHGKENGDELYI